MQLSDAYRKHHYCVQSVVRVIYQLQEAKARKEYSVVLIMVSDSKQDSKSMINTPTILLSSFYKVYDTVSLV